MLSLRLSLVLGIALASLVAGPPAGASEVRSPSPAIAADCSADVTASLQAFFDQVPDGATVQLHPDGCYRIDREITVAAKDRLTLDGRGATLRRVTASPRDRHYPKANAMLRFGDLTNSTITGLNIKGINTQSDEPDLRPRYGAWTTRHSFDHGIVLSGAQNVTLEHTTVDAVFGDGVYIGGSDTFPQARNVRVRDVSIDRNGRQGIAVTSADGVLIDGVTIAHGRRAGIDMEPHRDKVVSNVEIRNSQFTTRLLAITGSGVGEVSNVFVHHNTFFKSALPLVHDRSSGNAQIRRTDWRVIENEVDFVVRSSAPAMAFGNTEDVVVHGNRIDFALGSGVAVRLGKSTALVACNRFTGAIEHFVTADRDSSFRLDRNSRTDETPQCPTPALTTGVSDETSAEPSDETSAEPSPTEAKQQPKVSKAPKPAPSPRVSKRQARTLASAGPAKAVKAKKQDLRQETPDLTLASAINHVQDWIATPTTLVVFAVAAFGLAGVASRRRSRRRPQ